MLSAISYDYVSDTFNTYGSNSYSNGNSYVNSTSYDYVEGYGDNHDPDAKEKVNMIKQLLMKDIEQAIDKRLHSIFFGEKNRSH